MEDLFTFAGVLEAHFPIIVVSAHPDDEVIGLGARLPRLQTGWFIHATNGAPADGKDAQENGFASPEDYAVARRAELEAAMRLAGIASVRARSLRIVDQQASLQLPELTRAILSLLEQLQPGLVVTQPYEGGHPDHDATAFSVHAACRILQQRTGSAPELLEMTSYHQGHDGIEVGSFLPFDGYEVSTFALNSEERLFKTRLLGCFKTQQRTLKYFPVDVERFRPAPRYDFTVPPHPGQVFTIVLTGV